MNKLVVITGCSGGGKSTILSELQKKGYSVIPEVGRELVKEQLVQKSGITPWENPTAFCELLIERSIAAYYAASKMTNAKYEYRIIDLPKKSVEERLEFIFSSILLEQVPSIEIKKSK